MPDAERSAAARLLSVFEGVDDSPLCAAAGVVARGGTDRAFTLGVEIDADVAMFETGSLGKALVGIVLASLARTGAVDLDDPVGRWLAAGVNSDITLRQLATHASGLPRVAPDAHSHAGYSPDDPYAAYTPELAEAALAGCQRDNGGDTYSNFGFLILGLALERAAGMPLLDLIRSRATDPLDMWSVCAAASAHNLVPGYGPARQVPPWNMQLFGAGGLCLTAVDLVRLTEACATPETTPIGDDLTMAMTDLLGFNRRGRVVGKNGATAGFSVMVAVDASQGRGVMVVVNRGDWSERVTDAAVLAVEGNDPGSARPVAIDRRQLDRACAAARLLAAGDFAALLAAMPADSRAVLTEDRLAAAHQARVAPLGDLQGITLDAATSGDQGTVTAGCLARFVAGRLVITVSLNNTGEVIGIQLR